VLFTVYSPNYVPSGTWLALTWYCATMFLLELAGADVVLRHHVPSGTKNRKG